MFAVFLIVAASGALGVASIASVFGRQLYKPLSRLSGLLALTLLAGGLAVLVLDLGRPDRLIVAMTYYNLNPSSPGISSSTSASSSSSRAVDDDGTTDEQQQADRSFAFVSA